MDEGGYLVRLRGLPWSATSAEVIRFLDGCDVVGGEAGVHFVLLGGGRASGEAYVELATEEDVNKALAKDKCHLGRRYVDVFKSKRKDMELALKRAASQGVTNSSDVFVRIRGLPFGCTKEEVAHFFSGLMLAPNGITFLMDHVGQPNGQAFVQFASQDDAEKALLKHKDMMGRRYIEVFTSSLEEAMSNLSISSRHLPAGGRPPVHVGPRGGGGNIPGANFRGGGSFMGGSAGGFGRGAVNVGRGIGGGGQGSYSQHLRQPFSHDDCFHSSAPPRGNRASDFGGGQRGRGYFDDGFQNYGGYGGGDLGAGDCSGFGGFNGMDFGRSTGGGGGNGSGGVFANRRGGGGGARGGGANIGGIQSLAMTGRGGGTGGVGVGGSGGIGRNTRPPATCDSPGRHVVHMRGLPFSAAEYDIAQFFYPLNIVSINLGYNRDGRPSGEADIEFATHADAMLAMRKNRASMKSRYIELFLNSAMQDRTGQGSNFYGSNLEDNGLFDFAGEYTSF